MISTLQNKEDTQTLIDFRDMYSKNLHKMENPTVHNIQNNNSCMQLTCILQRRPSIRAPLGLKWRCPRGEGTHALVGIVNVSVVVEIQSVLYTGARYAKSVYALHLADSG